MFLSIIVPIYNVEQYIEKCLLSICQQLDVINGDCEVIIVNDGTPDKSMDIVRKFESEYTQIRVLEQTNKGLSIARNTGFNAAIGDYVWFVDSDDWLLPNSLMIVFQNILTHRDVDVFASALEFVSEATDVHKVEYYPKKLFLSGKEYLKFHYPPGASQRFIMKREFLIKNGLSFYPNILHEDGLFGYSMLYLVEKIFVFDKPIYAYLQRNEGSIMRTISIKSAYDLVFIHKELKAFMQKSVSLEDRVWYQECIYRIIECAFVFSKPILHTDDFKLFIMKNGTYIRQESKFLCCEVHSFLKGIIILHSPLFWLKCIDLKLFVKRFLLHKL